jgi:hypothetical protein
MPTGNLMRPASKREYWKRIHPRYPKADATAKQRLGDEFGANGSDHRQHAIRLLNGPPPAEKPRRKQRPWAPTYGARGVWMVKAVWEAADYPGWCGGKRCGPRGCPGFAGASGSPRRSKVNGCGSALAPSITAWPLPSGGCGIGSRAAPSRGPSLKHPIPLKTDPWEVQVPGFTRGRLGFAFEELGLRRFLLLAQTDGHLHRLDRNTGGAGAGPGRGAAGAGGDPPGLALSLARIGMARQKVPTEAPPRGIARIGPA